MKITCIATYPPRVCGIANFTRDLINAIAIHNKDSENKSDTSIIAINDHDQTYDYTDNIKFIIKQDHQRDYLEAAKFINFSDADVCLLQHEFGIFGGQSGIYILPLINRLKIPLIITMHTVLKNPTYNQKVITQQIGKEADSIVVMSNRAIKFLVDIYDIPSEKITLIEHGIPDFEYKEISGYKEKFHLEDKKVLMTFGLLNRNKGIETVIQALPRVVEKYPEVVYIVLGKTHPNVIRHSGEEYRNYLGRLVEKNNLRPYVYFYDRFFVQNELLEYLSVTDIYITPHLNEAQITSGTLSYAIGAGAAVISTPYWHAQELLSDGRGRFFNFKDSNGLTQIILELLDKPIELRELRKQAFEYGRQMIWPKIGAKYLDLADEIVRQKSKIKPKTKVIEEPIINPMALPHFKLEHVQRLTDNTGIIQHAKYSVPNYKEGYCLDDNARALLLVLMSLRRKKSREASDLMPVYLSYIHYMQNDDGTFRNFLGFNKQFLDEVGSEDSFGRTVWALGYLIRYAPNEPYFQLGKEIFTKTYPNFVNLQHLRGVANSITGICHYLHYFPSDEGMIKALRQLVKKIVKAYEETKTDEWSWFETKLTYDNGLMPLALLHYYEIMHDERILNIALEVIAFLEKIYFENNFLSLVGSDGWYNKGGDCPRFPQQPVDAMMATLMFYQAYVVTKRKHYLQRMFSSFMWFLGENELRIPLYDFETNGCCDGLEHYGVNRNQGAESILSYCISHLTVLDAYELEERDSGRGLIIE